MNLFWDTAGAVFWAILKILTIALAGGASVRWKILDREHIRGLSILTITITLPCLIFAKMVHGFSPDSFPFWWVLPLTALGMTGLGMLLAILLLGSQFKSRKNLLPLASMQNANFLILPIGKMVYPDHFDQFVQYIFLYIIGFNLVLWSLGGYLSTLRSQEQVRWQSFITPPFAANIAALGLVFTGLNTGVPGIVTETCLLLGEATIPLSLFVLGATLASLYFKKSPPFLDTVRLLSVKFLLLPLITITVLRLTGILDHNWLLADFFVLQSSSAPAI